MHEPHVRTAQGEIKGAFVDGIWKFQGVPYARTTAGKNRFCPPQAVTPWEGVRDATHRAPIAPQGPSDLEATMGVERHPYSEECLTLTINTPALDGRLPVAVWFHGGANISGAGNLDWYDGAALARRGNIVVVGVNFRLAAFGVLYHPQVNTENLSILDQIAALRWVQENIAAFGGDPGRVTVFGQSAGANAIVHMMALPQTEGLFQSAILESPSIGRANHVPEDAVRIAGCLMGHLGVDPKDPDVKGKMQAASIESILAATDACFADMGREFGGMLFKPVKPEWNTPEATAEAAAREAVRRHLNIVIGTTADEMHAFVQPTDDRQELAVRVAQFERYDKPDDLFARLAAQGGCPVWKYHFEWRAPDSKFAACHTIELPFVFGTLKAWEDSPMLGTAAVADKERLTDTMQSYWCRFFTSGAMDEALWPRFSSQRPMHKIFDNVDNGCREIVFEKPDENSPKGRQS